MQIPAKLGEGGKDHGSFPRQINQSGSRFLTSLCSLTNFTILTMLFGGNIAIQSPSFNKLSETWTDLTKHLGGNFRNVL